MYFLTEDVPVTSIDWKQTLIYAGLIIGYYIIIYLKKLILKSKKQTKKIEMFNTIFNIVLFFAFIIAILIVSGVNFESIKDFSVVLLEKNTGSLVGTIIVVIITSTLLNTLKMLLVKTNNRNRRKQTLGKVISSIIKYVVYIIDAAIILALWGVNIGPVLAGLGIAGLVIGLGAQKLINDFISGVFIIFEHHFDIGDTVQIDGFTGTIIDIGLKTTKVKSWKGEVKIVSNGNIDTLINYSVNDMVAVVEFGIAYKENVDEVISLLNKELPIYFKDSTVIVEEPKIVGVVGLNESEVTLRATCITKTGEQHGMERELRKTIKEVLDKNGVEIPFPQVVVHQGE